MSTLVEKKEYFWKPKACTNFLDQLRVKESECYRNRGSARKSLFLNIFARIFAYFPHLTIFSYVQQLKKIVLQVKINIVNTKTPKIMFIEYVALCFFRPYGGHYILG